jgi:hypothetical protein
MKKDELIADIRATKQRWLEGVKKLDAEIARLQKEREELLALINEPISLDGSQPAKKRGRQPGKKAEKKEAEPAKAGS